MVKTSMTVQEIREKFADFIKTTETVQSHQSAVIQDYPIGGSNRGQCKLSVDKHKTRGWRLLCRPSRPSQSSYIQ